MSKATAGVAAIERMSVQGVNAHMCTAHYKSLMQGI
jgi:hypothetical protein